MAVDSEGATPVSMVERMTLLLDAFDAGSARLTLAELVERTGLPRSSTHRIVEQLVALRWLDHSGQSYALGMRVLELGGLAVAHHELRDVVGPLLTQLHRRTGAVAHLAVLDRRDAVVVDRVGSGLSSDGATRVGGRSPAHASAAGKAMLAWMDDRVLGSLYRERLPSRTPRTLTTLDQLRQELARVRSRGGLAFEREEVAQGASGVAVALRGSGGSLAALQLSGPSPGVQLERWAPLLQEASQQAARVLEAGSGRRRKATSNVPVPSPWPAGALDRLVQGIGGDYWL